MKMQKLVALVAVFAAVSAVNAATEAVDTIETVAQPKFKKHRTVGLTRKAKKEQVALQEQAAVVQQQNVQRWGAPGMLGFETEDEIRARVAEQEGEFGHPYMVGR